MSQCAGAVENSAFIASKNNLHLIPSVRRKRLCVRDVRHKVRIEKPELEAALADQAKNLLVAKGFHIPKVWIDSVVMPLKPGV